MATSYPSENDPPPSYEPPAHGNQYPPMMIQQGGVQMMYPNQSTQPGVPYVVYPVSGKKHKHRGNQMMYLTQPMGSPITNQPQQIYNPQMMTEVPQPTPYTYTPKYATLHFRIGIFFIAIGIATCMMDPLIPALTNYPYSVLPAGIFMIISGATSLAGSNRTRRCLLVVSMIFDILASIAFFGGFIAGIIMVVSPYQMGQQGFAIFMLIFCPILFSVVIWDSSIKCCDTCCCVRRLKKPKNPVYIYVVQSPPGTVPS